MWIWACELHRLGFRRRSPHYWRCDGRYGLPASAYLSLFHAGSDGESSRTQPSRIRFDVSAFHVTYCLGVDRVHFYYHEAGELSWEPGGHTSSRELRRLGVKPANMRAAADDIAARVAEAMGVTLQPRRQRRRRA